MVDSTAQALPPEASASDLVTMDDAAFVKQFGLGEGKPSSPADAGSAGDPEPKEEVAPEQEVEEEVVEEQAPVAEQEEEQGETEEKPKEEEAPAPKKVPLTKFAIFEGEEEVELPEDLVFRYEANGKPREVPLDKLIAIAQMGHYNHEKQQESRQLAEQARATLSENEQLKATIQQYQQYYDKMFTDLEFYDAAREGYLKEQTPEAKIQRERQTLEQQRAEFAREQESRTVSSFVSQALTPALVQLVNDNPHVTQHEVLGLYTQLTAHLLDRGRLPVGKLAEVAAIVERDLAHEVRGLNEERTEAEAKKQRTLEVARGKTVAAKRQIARAVAPRGAARPDTPKPKSYESAQDWFKNDPLLNPT